MRARKARSDTGSERDRDGRETSTNLEPPPALDLMLAGPEGGPSSDMQRYEG